METISTRMRHPKRRNHPKVKTGCLTCKIRRVKCGEEKPACLRCIRFGMKCDGYISSSNSRNPSSTRPLLLKPQGAPLSTTPSLPRFESEQEYRYFEIFYTKTAFEIFPSFEMGRLRQIFLQACESELSIRHATIALGALDKASQASQHHSLLPCSSLVENATRHHHNALKEYMKAIKCMQISIGQQDLRTTLMTCLVILSFEGWKGNYEQAVRQIKIGTSLLREWRKRYKDSARSGFSSPAPNVVEDVLIDVFARLSIQLVSSAAERSSMPYSSLNTDHREAIDNMPGVFSTIEEAGNFQIAILRLLICFVSKGRSPTSVAATCARAYPVNVFWGAMSREVALEQETIIRHILRWLDAFAPLKSRLSVKDGEEKTALITLELHIKSSYISAVTACAEDEAVFDSYYDFYNDIVNLSEALLNGSQPLSMAKSPKFCFDSGVVIPLWSVGHKCRAADIRRRAVSLLLNYPRKEGIWDSIIAGRIIECVIELEEEYNEDGYIPSWARLRSIMFKPGLEARTIDVECQQRTEEWSETLITRRKVISW